MNEENLVNVKVVPTMARAKYVDKQKQRKLLMLLALLIVLLLTFLAFIRYYYTQEEPLPTVDVVEKGKILPPNFVSVSLGGSGMLALEKPLAIAVHPNGNLYVTSSASNGQKRIQGRIEVLKPDGTFSFAFEKIDGKETLKSPVYIAINRAGDVYVTDKLKRAIYIFESNGKFKKKFIPNNDPKFLWLPIALAFDQDDNLYVTDIYTEHQVLVFDIKGNLKLKFGSAAFTETKNKFPGKFFFPNGLFIDNDKKVFVADSNNRRVQVFSEKGKFLYMINTGGLPRGIWIDGNNRLYVVDALGHDVSVFSKSGKPDSALAIFGEQGVSFGQFLYPNGIALDKSGRRIYVADRENNRIQTWAWPIVAGAVSIPVKKTLPFALLLLVIAILLAIYFLRKRRYFATGDFLHLIVTNGQIDDFAKSVKRVYVFQNIFDEFFKHFETNSVGLGGVLRPIKHIQESSSAVAKTYALSEESAAILSSAQVGWIKSRILSEDGNVHQAAGKLDIETMDYDLFSAYHFSNKR